MNLLTGKSPAPVSLPDTLTDVLRAPVNGEDTNDECLEKRVYYKIISGWYLSFVALSSQCLLLQVCMRRYRRISVESI